jgi:hypothetical protein
MTLPLRKEKPEGSPRTAMDPSSREMQQIDIGTERERPRLLQPDPETAILEPERGPDVEVPAAQRTKEMAARAATESAQENTPLFPSTELQDFQGRWDRIQTAFVDQPRQAVRDADSLVSDAVERLADTFAAERSKLEKQWDGGDNVSTEDLRVALQRYRSFFQRMLSV